MKIAKLSFEEFIYNNYYILALFFYFLTMFIPTLPVGVICALLMLYIFIVKYMKRPEQMRYMRNDVFCVFVYFLFCIFSVLFYFGSELPISVYVQAISNTLFPVLFVFYEPDDIETFWKRFNVAYVLTGLIGLLLMIQRSSFYVSFCLSRGYDYRRLSSFIGSIPMGSLGAVAVIVSLKAVISSRGKKGKILYLLSLVGAIASMQRSAWVVTLVSLVVFHYYCFFKYQMVKARYLVIEVLIIIFIAILFKDFIYSTYLEWYNAHQYTESTRKIAEMFSGRSGQWERGLGNSNLIFGSGFGSRGHKAQAIGYQNYVADGSWILILCESGILGLALLMKPIIKSIVVGIYNLRDLYLPTAVLLIFSFQSIGSNILELQITAPLFWISLGHIVRFNYEKE